MILEGLVVYKQTNVGSKSEKMTPFIYKGMGEYLKIWKSGDLSWNGEALERYDGKRVIAQGTMNEYDVFLIEEINSEDTAKSKNNDNIEEERK